MRAPSANAHLVWLRANKHDLGPLTGTDHKALRAVDACWELYAYTGGVNVRQAAMALVNEMQPSTRYLARELIARHLDWGDRDRLWPLETEAGEPARATS